jgi:hypothetical protein
MASSLPDLPEIGLQMEPELIAGDIRLRDYVEEWLAQGNAWHVSHGDANGLTHELVIEVWVSGEPRCVD